MIIEKVHANAHVYHTWWFRCEREDSAQIEALNALAFDNDDLGRRDGDIVAVNYSDDILHNTFQLRISFINQEAGENFIKKLEGSIGKGNVTYGES